MEAYPEIMTDNQVNESFNLSVCANEKRAGLFIIVPVGSINTNTYPILQREMDRIFEWNFKDDFASISHLKQTFKNPI